MPLLPLADYMAPVPLKRKRDMSAEPKTNPAKRAYMGIPDEAKLWVVDFHAHSRVHSLFSVAFPFACPFAKSGKFCRGV